MVESVVQNGNTSSRIVKNGIGGITNNHRSSGTAKQRKSKEERPRSKKTKEDTTTTPSPTPTITSVSKNEGKHISKETTNQRTFIIMGFIFIIAFITLRRELLATARAGCENNNDPTSQTSKTKSKNILSKEITDGNNDDTPIKYAGPQTTYKRWKNPFPCFPAEQQWNSQKIQRSPADTGLLYTREMKTGSSTLAGVLLRIAHTKADKYLPNKKYNGNQRPLPCRLRVDHGSARAREYIHRSVKKSYHISMLRDPTKRAISEFFHFRVSDRQIDPTDANFLSYFMDDVEAASRWNYYLKDLSVNETLIGPYSKVSPLAEDNHKKALEKLTDVLIEDILHRYDFIAITERLDESLVVMKLLLDLDYSDILYMSAKRKGTFTPGGSREHPCIYIIPSFLTDGMKDFFSGPLWNRESMMGGDQKLYAAAVQSLENTIDMLGRDLVNEQVGIFQKALDHAHKECNERTIYRCNGKGEFVGGGNSTCYLWDIGCGYECLNELDITDIVEAGTESGNDATDGKRR